jgi:hypothetical protein
VKKGNASGFSEQLLRSQGYAPDAKGVWVKQDPASGNPGGRPDPEQPAKPPLAGKPQGQGQDAPRDGLRPRCLVIATIHTVRLRDYDGLGAAVKGIIDRLIELQRIPVKDDGPLHLEVVCENKRCEHFADQKTVIEVFVLPSRWDEQT